MSLVLELQRDALNESVRVSELLRKAYMVARKLKIKDFQEWVEQELNGYQYVDGSEIPPYRKIAGSLSYFNPYHGWQPIVFSEIDDTFKIRPCLQGVAELENVLSTSRGSDASGTLGMELPDSLVTSLADIIGFNTRIMFIISPSQIVGLLDAVRNIILRWSMDLEEKGIMGEGLQFTRAEQEKAKTGNNITQYIVGSQVQVQQGTSHSSQMFRQSSLDKEELQRLIESIENELDDISDDENKKVIRADVESLKSQADSPKPNKTVVKTLLSSLMGILGDVGKMVIVDEIGKYIASL